MLLLSQEHGNNRMVGWLQGLEGLSMLLFALPFGMWADRWRRDRVLKVASCLEMGEPLRMLRSAAVAMVQRYQRCD